MFNFYQKYNQRDEKDEAEPNVIGHERWYQERSRSSSVKIKRKSERRPRSLSAVDISQPTLDRLDVAQKRALFQNQKSRSTESKKESFTKSLFSKRSSSVPRHEYSALRLENAERGNPEKSLEDGAFTSCQHYLSNNERYDLQRHLGNVGSRPDKQWFVVKDKSLGAERLLSLIEIPSLAPIKPTPITRETLLELFRSLHHPYIHPILDIEFWECGAALVSPLNYFGSLKDLIYDATWRDEYNIKYNTRGQGLPFRQVQCLGRQILEALLFLRNRNFPKFYHLHSGNIIIQNGVARLAGLENTLLALPPKPPAVNDSVAFGYLLFEMTIGYEMPTPPSSAHMSIELERIPKIADVIHDIFGNEDTPTLEDLVRNDLFKGVELRELRRTTGITYTTSRDVSELLEIVRNTTPPIPKQSDVEMLENRILEEVVEEELNKVENETITVIIESR